MVSSIPDGDLLNIGTFISFFDTFVSETTAMLKVNQSYMFDTFMNSQVAIPKFLNPLYPFLMWFILYMVMGTIALTATGFQQASVTPKTDHIIHQTKNFNPQNWGETGWVQLK